MFGFQGKPEQVESIWSLLVEREDRIFVAKTGYGKSVVPQLLPLIIKNSIVIILLPLNALDAEQLEDIEKPLAKPFWLHAGNNNVTDHLGTGDGTASSIRKTLTQSVFSR